MAAFYMPVGFPIMGIGPGAVSFGLAGPGRPVFTLGKAPILYGVLLAPSVLEGHLLPSTRAEGSLIDWTVVYGGLEPGH